MRAGAWKFVSVKGVQGRYQWDERPGHYFHWWEGEKRRREFAGATPSQALTAQRRKQMEVVGARVLNGTQSPQGRQSESEVSNAPALEPLQQTRISGAVKLFLAHVGTHSPDKPETQRRHAHVMRYFERLLGHRKSMEDVRRADIDEYKTKRRDEKANVQGGRSRRRPSTSSSARFGFLLLLDQRTRHRTRESMREVQEAQGRQSETAEATSDVHPRAVGRSIREVRQLRACGFRHAIAYEAA
jgi:hypothetical protein